MVKSKERSQNKTYAQKLIPVIIIAIVVYTIVAILLQFFDKGEISSTLTTCYFSFWTVELVNLAMIKHGKVRTIKEYKEMKSELEDGDDMEESEG